MKKLIALFCLLALVLAGCAAETTPEQTETEPVEQTTVPMPEQIVETAKSPLIGSWQATLNKGQYAAQIYYLQTGGDEESAMHWLGYMQEVTYPLTVTVDLNEDGTYNYTVHPDPEGEGVEEFALGLYNGMVRYFMDLKGCSEDAAKDFMADNGTALWDVNSNIKKLNMDKMFLNAEVNTGTWEQNDKGLFLSGWCTVQFEEADGVMTWLTCDDLQQEENLPLTFTKQ